MTELGKALVAGGLVMAAVGALLWSGVGLGCVGRLPGDLHFKRGGVEVYLPLGTCIAASAVLTLLSWLARGRH